MNGFSKLTTITFSSKHTFEDDITVSELVVINSDLVFQSQGLTLVFRKPFWKLYYEDN